MSRARFHQKWLDYHEINECEVALDKPLVFEGSRGDVIVVPRGFVTDFASIPGFLHGFMRPRGKITRAAIVHDRLCTLLLTKRWTINGRDADGLFRLMLRISGVPFWMQWFLWVGVRWGALFSDNTQRRVGWWRDGPMVAAVSLIALPVVLPIGVAALLSWLLMLPLSLIAWVCRVR